jgi:arsenite methyltransferase
MTTQMIELAKKNKEKRGEDFRNVEFILGEITSLPLPNNFADVVISNCVINLVEDKRKAFEGKD